MSEKLEDGAATLSIGAISQATGIPPETLRTWERRYGFPDPTRTEGGHRLYGAADIERLLLINRAIDAGNRPGQVVKESIEHLEALLGITHDEPEERNADDPDAMESAEELIAYWIDRARDFDALSIERSLTRAWYTRSPLHFLEDLVGGFLTALGEAWAAGEISVAQEHFVSERLLGFLSTQWRPMADRNIGEQIVCAALPGELHVLGLHMVALVVALTGRQVRFLGASTPIQEILGACDGEHTRALLISMSGAYDADLARSHMEELVADLPADLELIVGGGLPIEVPAPAKRLKGLRDLRAHLLART